ncbi:PD-(D/E)XK nuclease family transposase [uncultured Lamprocystis sp.]|jgi:hypothetical protein|uniref:PD-(D/E)XK nuclease family transposase n=1 Tax=uncultured Lamprocystis sp. TaxID=543132 RepID=UPI0025DC1196|nr:PD-(D/E)XK nuclease family transposase [uncultured Lamprocystis sp.]
MTTRKLISFDWAMKWLLRSKANFGILEGFLSELLREDVQIVEVLESESNRDTADDRSNRLDLKVRNHRGELLLIEVQYERRHARARTSGTRRLRALAGRPASACEPGGVELCSWQDRRTRGTHLEIARAMKANGVAASVIAESTGLALEVVTGL